MFIFKICLLHLFNISRVIFLHIFPWVASLMMLIISGIIYSFIVRYTLINYQGLKILGLVPILFFFYSYLFYQFLITLPHCKIIYVQKLILIPIKLCPSPV